MPEILLYPFLACLVLAGIHCYLGIHVVMRGVIFVDLALAQIAAMGAAVGILAGCAPDSGGQYAFSLGFTVLGAAVFAIGRFRDQRVPQEAIIGIVYAVSTALAILILSQTSIEAEEIEHMLKGRLLFVQDGREIFTMLTIYAGVGLVHFLLRRPFFEISRSSEQRLSRAKVRLWDFVFYVSFGVVVTSSVNIAGVLLVFSFLVAPAVCAMMVFEGVLPRLFLGWAIGCAATVIGLWASLRWDAPPGVSIVTVFGAFVLVFSIIHALHRKIRAANPKGVEISPLNNERNPPTAAAHGR